MEELLKDILHNLREYPSMGESALEKIIRRHNRRLRLGETHFAKKQLMPYFINLKENHPELLEEWGLDPELETRLVRLLQVKPNRTASGVATVTVITKPWTCSNNCIYCPNDVRMPKSYLCDEPACQRAERNFFDPYLQVASRIRALSYMGHPTDKVELIVLGGTWDDYPEGYRIWFIEEMFRALNDGEESWELSRNRRREYRAAGISYNPNVIEHEVEEIQGEVTRREVTFNEAVREIYGKDSKWGAISVRQVATMEQLSEQHRKNETADHRVVGLVVETRPDKITARNLTLLRELGCTKVQIGVQSTRDEVLRANHRGLEASRISEALALTRAFGFKIHAHFMVNLVGADPDSDKKDYSNFVTSPGFSPDEVKLYPCSLTPGTDLVDLYKSGEWKPYSREELIDVLVSDIMSTPDFIRVSRMIRDIPSVDIIDGNKMTNLRQLVERKIRELGLSSSVREIRFREIRTDSVSLGELKMAEFRYETDSTLETFLQWVTGEGKIAGFLRLSFPREGYVEKHSGELPIGPGEAMIREVHVYGRAAKLHLSVDGAQHMGLGKALVEEACRRAASAGFEKINVISSVGTREYYRKLGFHDKGLYQQRDLH
ncbi:MAG: elongator complex protein 3 [Coriobacteriales bacterium]|jgi:elongator complex protein 3